MKRFKNWIFFAFLTNSWGWGVLLAEALPPIGERTYVQEASDPYGELKIEPVTGKKGAEGLRDPGNTVKKGKPIFLAAPVKKKPQVVDYKPRNIKFGATQINGRISKPRVNFRREFLPMKRVDEPLVSDFYNRVFSETSGDL